VNQPCNGQASDARSGVESGLPEQPTPSNCASNIHQGSMTPAHASVGAAATWPTSGTIFNPADATRHGAAATPHPAKPTNVAHSATIAHHFT
jgi:hypothetical protein